MPHACGPRRGGDVFGGTVSQIDCPSWRAVRGRGAMLSCRHWPGLVAAWRDGGQSVQTGRMVVLEAMKMESLRRQSQRIGRRSR